jgi:uncharacterized membrane protein
LIHYPQRPKSAGNPPVSKPKLSEEELEKRRKMVEERAAEKLRERRLKEELAEQQKLGVKEMIGKVNVQLCLMGGYSAV